MNRQLVGNGCNEWHFVLDYTQTFKFKVEFKNAKQKLKPCICLAVHCLYADCHIIAMYNDAYFQAHNHYIAC